jgi:DNA-binding MarR family transcriptional regulator
LKNNQSLVDSYEQLNSKYYYNFEYYYYRAISQLLPGALDLRDILILFTIEGMQKNKTNTSTLIAQNVKMSASAFSNYLRTLEKEELVERERGMDNRKLMYITLTSRGKALNKLVKGFIQGYVKRLVVKFGLVDGLRYLNMVITASQIPQQTKSMKLSVFSPQKALSIITEALRHINYNIYTQEEDSLVALTPSMTIREMRLLHGVLHLSKEGEVTPSQLGNYLGFAMSTMTSMLKSLESNGLIHRKTVKSDLRKLLITLDSSAMPLIEMFMSNRLQTFNDLLELYDDHEKSLLETSFQLLKEYSLDSIKQ